MKFNLGSEALYTAAQTRALDAAAIAGGIPGITLMARAAAASFNLLIELWPNPELIQVFCGVGNNGGDGYLIADLAQKRGFAVQVWQLGDTGKIAGDAKLAREQALLNGVVEQQYSAGCVRTEGIVVDAMLGTGLGGDVREQFSLAIQEIASVSLPVLSIDIPSGLCSDTGRVLGSAVCADATICFIGLKRGLFTLDAPNHTGVIQFTDLQIPSEIFNHQSTRCQRLTVENMLLHLPKRSATAHKGTCGSALVVGGDHGMGGAVVMAAEAALRCGTGLVRVGTRGDHVSAILARRPEVMASSVASGQELSVLLNSADVLIVGPGLGQSPWSEQLLQVAAAADKPMVLDADGLNLLGNGNTVDQRRRENWILTPHPGEAARLLETTTSEIQRDRFAAVVALQKRYGGVVVLKGNGSLIASADQVLLSDYGNSGMASGGMGDVLSGVIGSLMAQKMEPLAAACLGVCLHGAAADEAAKDGENGLLASDLMAPMRALLG
ncbi:MAG: NAD(P)H-hydrate dehydratase [Halioglobus sp.]